MLVLSSRSEAHAHPIETSRLILAPLDTIDARDLWVSVDAYRAHLEPWLPWVPFAIDVESSYRYTEASAYDWDNSRAARFSIRERMTRKFFGVVGLESFAHLHESAELGYWLRLDATGRGIMTEACQGVLKWAFGPLNAHRIRVAAATDNHASLSVIHRLGFRFEGIARQAERCHGRWLDHAIFARLAGE